MSSAASPGDDRIVGGAGADTLTGGADNDTFVFDSAPNAVDSITDFDASETAASQDEIELSLAIFSGLTAPAGSTLVCVRVRVDRWRRRGGQRRRRRST